MIGEYGGEIDGAFLNATMIDGAIETMMVLEAGTETVEHSDSDAVQTFYAVCASESASESVSAALLQFIAQCNSDCVGDQGLSALQSFIAEQINNDLISLVYGFQQVTHSANSLAEHCVTLPEGDRIILLFNDSRLIVLDKYFPVEVKK